MNTIRQTGNIKTEKYLNETSCPQTTARRLNPNAREVFYSLEGWLLFNIKITLGNFL